MSGTTDTPGITATQGVTVTGTGTASSVPDRLHLGIGVEVRRPTAPHAYLQAAGAASRVLEALDASGVPRLKRSTHQIGLRAEIIWGENQKQRVSGYVASQDLAVTLDDLASASAVLDAVVRAGGDDARINSLSFGFADSAALAAQAQEAAWQDARDKAQRWAVLAGCTLGAVEEVSEGSAATPLPASRRMMVAMAEDSSMPIEPGEADVVCTVTVRWRIDPAG